MSRSKKMKSPLVNSVLYGIFASALLALVSCAPTAPQATDTTTLVASTPTLALTKADSIKQTNVSMTCGCPFPVYIDAMGGDTAAIAIAFADNMADSKTPHLLQASFKPSTLGTSHNTAWVALHSIHHAVSGPITLFDTVHVTADVP